MNLTHLLPNAVMLDHDFILFIKNQVLSVVIDNRLLVFDKS